MIETVRCQLYNTQHHDSIGRVEIDHDLLLPDARLVNPENMSLDSIKGGAIYTLIPLEDHTVATLKHVKAVHKQCHAALDSFNAAFSRMDNLLGAVDLLFGEIEYRRITDSRQLEYLIQPSTKNEEFEPPIVRYSILGDMITNALKEVEDEEKQSDEQTCSH